MNKSQEVETWFENYAHPHKDAMLRVRDIILTADDRLTETIKWSSPTFMFEGNLASFNPRTKSHVSLIFHAGASIPGEHPRLEGGGDTVRYMRFDSLNEVEALQGDLVSIVQAWCALKTGQTTQP